jgi:hypothetical protein
MNLTDNFTNTGISLNNVNTGEITSRPIEMNDTNDITTTEGTEILKGYVNEENQKHK